MDEPKQLHFDGWQNVMTQLGTSRDKRMSAEVFWTNYTPEILENFYSGDEIATRIVDLIPEESMRKWIRFTGADKKKNLEREQICEMLGVREMIEQTWKWGRLYGGALLYMVTDSGNPSQPLQPGERVIGLQDLSRHDVRIFNTEVESNFASPNWGNPNRYYLQVQVGSDYKGWPIHWTRLIRFDGAKLPRRKYIRNNYWHDSVLQRLFNVIRNYQTSHDSAASILQDFNVGVFKMSGLSNLLASGKENLVKQRLQMINFGKSVIRAVILDDQEEYIDTQRQVSGLADLLRIQGTRLVAATEIPHTKLLGESPDGSNATGNSTTLQWYDYIQSVQNNYLRPKLKLLFRAVFQEEVEFEFNELWQLDEVEEANKRATQAQTDSIYIQNGVLDPSEVARSRFGGDKYSTDTQLDKEARAAGLITGFEPGEEDEAGLYSALEAEAVEQVEGVRGEPQGTEVDNSGAGANELNNTQVEPRTVKQRPFISSQMSEPFRSPPFDENLNSQEENTERFRLDSDLREVATIEVVNGDKILMGKRRDNGKWTMPGGHIEPGENRLEGALRELKEETGLDPNESQLFHMQSRVIPGSDGKGLQVHHFRVDVTGMGLQTSILEDPDREVEVWKFYPIDRIPKSVMNNLHAKQNVILEHYGLIPRMDAGESALFSRQLDFFKKKNKDVKP